MAKLSHFVVSYNHETRKFSYDVETTLSKFVDGWIWDEEKEEWGFPETELDDGNDTDGVDELAILFRTHAKNQ